MIPFFNSKTGKYLTVHPTFNLVPWIISDYFASLDLSQATIKTHDRGGIICPWEPEGLVWEYKTRQGDWAVDSSISVVCSNIDN